MIKPSVLNRRGFLRALGLLTGAVLVAPAVLAFNKPAEEDAWVRVTHTNNPWRSADDPLRSTCTINLPPATPGQTLVIKDANCSGNVIIKVQDSRTESFEGAGSYLHLDDAGSVRLMCVSKSTWRVVDEPQEISK